MTKDIKDYEGLYFLNELGEVFSYPKRTRKGIRKLLPNKSNCGYFMIDLCKDGKVKKFLIHRLMAQTYLKNDEDKTQVNHINGIKTDNRIENLQWATHSENSIHAFSTGLNKISNLCNINKIKAKSKLVINLSNGVFYNSAKEASIAAGINYYTFMGYLGKHKTNKSTFIYI